MVHPDESQLVESIQGGRAVVVAGTGVSIAASFDASANSPHPNASWTGLLEDGLVWLHERGLIEKAVADAHLMLMRHSPQTHIFISAAEEVARGLGGAGSQHFADWLKRTVGTIEARDCNLLNALSDIRRLGNLLATTNYDGLLLGADARLTPVTWSETDELETIILDWKSYERIARDERYRDDLVAFWKTNIWVYVGCGVNGLGDPDFGLLLERYGPRARVAGHWDYCLVPDLQKQEFQAHFDSMGFNIRAVGIGRSHNDLPDYLRSMLPQPKPLSLSTSVHPASGARTARLGEHVAASIAEQIDAARNRELKFRSPHLLRALIGLPDSLTIECLEVVRPGYAQALRNMLNTYFARQAERLEERGFDPFEADEHPIVRAATENVTPSGAASKPHPKARRGTR